jgi:hypothetical protein
MGKSYHCAHVWGAGSISIQEETVRVSRYSFQEGEIVSHSQDTQSINDPGKIHVTCSACGFKHTYNLHSPVLPLWVTDLVIAYQDMMKADRAVKE